MSESSLPPGYCFFIPATHITPEELRLLKNSSVSYLKDCLEGTTGFIFNETAYNQFLVVKGWDRNFHINFHQSSMQGVLTLSVRSEMTEPIRDIPTVTVGPSTTPAIPSSSTEASTIATPSVATIPEPVISTKNYKFSINKNEIAFSDEFLHTTLQSFANSIEKEVVLTCPHGRLVEHNPDDPKFSINIWSTPSNNYQSATLTDEGNRSSAPPVMLFTKEVKCRDAGYIPTGIGVPIIDPKTEYIMAELFHNALFIHFDVCHHNHESSQYIFSQILETSVTLYKKHFVSSEPVSYLMCLPNRPNDQIPNTTGMKLLKDKIKTHLKVPGNIYYSYGGSSIEDVSHLSRHVTNPDIYRVYVGFSDNRELIEGKVVLFEKYTFENNIYLPTNSDNYVIKYNDIAIAEINAQKINILIRGLVTTQFDILDFILQKATEFYHLSAEDQLKLIEEQRGISKERNEKLFIDTMKKKQELFETQLKSTINDFQKKIATHQNSLIECLRELDINQKLLQNMTENSQFLSEKAKREIRTICKNKKVFRTRLSEGKLIVTTKNIYCKHPKTNIIYDIGIFDISIYLNPSEGSYPIIFRNLKHKKLPRPAPHVYPKGNACFGNINKIIPELLGKYEFAAVTDICIQFLESVNTDDAFGREITLFPEFYNPSKDTEKKGPPVINYDDASIISESQMLSTVNLPKPINPSDIKIRKEEVVPSRETERIIDVPTESVVDIESLSTTSPTTSSVIYRIPTLTSTSLASII